MIHPENCEVCVETPLHLHDLHGHRIKPRVGTFGHRGHFADFCLICQAQKSQRLQQQRQEQE